MGATTSLESQLADAMAELEKAKQRLAALRRQLPPEPVADYELMSPEAGVRLSALFGDKSDLISDTQHGRRLSLLHHVGR